MKEARAQTIRDGRAVLGIELGSTRIKAVLIGEDHLPVASGTHSWENRFENGLWTYPLEEVWTGLQAAYQDLKADVLSQYGVELKTLRGIGISAMMHGYLVFDDKDRLLCPFRTWRNTMTEPAAQQLSDLFQFNIPQRWCVAHLQQAILNDEQHVKDIRHMTTLAGFVHWQLTGRRVVGTGDAAGIFPIDSERGIYHPDMVQKFDALHPDQPWKLLDLLPEILPAGREAGRLTKEGARLLDPTGGLEAGIPFCPPEGDVGTGIVATNSVAPRTGNISAGTSIFAMITLEHALRGYYPEVDVVCTPSGMPVAMVHCNNCTTELNAWVKLFQELCGMAGWDIPEGELFPLLFRAALQGDKDCGGLLSYNFFSGEHIVEIEKGRPLFVKLPDSRFSLPNFMRAQLLSAMSCLALGLEILLREEQVRIDRLMGHGGLFKTPEVAQRLMAGALNTPITVMETASEGGAWGIALLAAYMATGKGKSLESFLAEQVFDKAEQSTIQPDREDSEGFQQYLTRYKAGLTIARAAESALT